MHLTLYERLTMLNPIILREKADICRADVDMCFSNFGCTVSLKCVFIDYIR